MPRCVSRERSYAPGNNSIFDNLDELVYSSYGGQNFVLAGAVTRRFAGLVESPIMTKAL
jgi:hypothetical protein